MLQEHRVLDVTFFKMKTKQKNPTPSRSWKPEQKLLEWTIILLNGLQSWLLAANVV